MNKKKICIIIICILTFIILTNLLIIFFSKKDIEIARIEENETLEDENIVEKNIVSDEVEENNVIENPVVENISTAETTQDEISNNKKDMTTTTKSNQGRIQGQSENSKSQSSNASQSKTTTQTQNNSTQVVTGQQTQENNQTETKEEVTPVVPVQKKEEYKINTSVIDDITEVITNNPSKLMLEKGYSIYVDASIKTATNQFTYSEARVIEKIKNKFGVIRIYAESYYVNGQYIITECYIL